LLRAVDALKLGIVHQNDHENGSFFPFTARARRIWGNKC